MNKFAAVVDQLISWGSLEAPKESCGLLVCDGQEDYRLYWLPNISDAPNTSFRLESKVVGGLIRSEEFYGKTYVWHTHPGGLIGPSQHDLLSAITGVKHMVITIPSGEVISYQRHK